MFLNPEMPKNYFEGKKPSETPPRTEDFDELEKKNIDNLIDAIKYIATSSGIIIAIYSKILQDYLKDDTFFRNSLTQLLLFTPILFWFFAIVGTVLGIYPRAYTAKSDGEKQKVINIVKKTKRFWLRVVLYFFLSGFALFLYIIFSQIFTIYPFTK